MLKEVNEKYKLSIIKLKDNHNYLHNLKFNVSYAIIKIGKNLGGMLYEN